MCPLVCSLFTSVVGLYAVFDPLLILVVDVAKRRWKEDGWLGSFLIVVVDLMSSGAPSFPFLFLSFHTPFVNMD